MGKLFEASTAIQVTTIIKSLYPDTTKAIYLGTSAYKEAVDFYAECAVLNKLNKVFNCFRSQFDA